tara:strand:- start:2199 stop:3221 length:1023 start_codon:yes stop_codon:yes gene_type:complete
MSKNWKPKSSKSSKSSKKYYCHFCDYTASQKSNYDKHLSSKKHQKRSLQNGIQSLQKVSKMETLAFSCKFCDKKYKTKGGMYKHMKKCKFKDMVSSKSVNICEKVVKSSNSFDEKDERDLEIVQLKNKIIEMKDDKIEMQSEIIKNLQSTNEKLTEICEEQMKNGGTTNNFNNCGNQNISIKVFLNENCKDALNLTDFVKNIKVTLEDLAYTKNNGYIDGVTNIIKKQLEDLKPTERPIHCSDKKRLKFYVKENDKWEKDEDNKKLDETIRNVKLKQTQTVTEWENANPNYRKDPKLRDEWMNIMAGITEGDTGNALKEKLVLKKRIASYIELKEAMEKT